MTDQTEGCLLASTAHELPGTEFVDRLRQSAFELIAFDLPLRMLQARLKRQGSGRQADEQADEQAGQDEAALAHGGLHGISGVPVKYRSRWEKLEGQMGVERRF